MIESPQFAFGKPRVLVVIPAYNEEGTIAGVVSEIKDHVDWDVLVVDDKSVDSTANQAKDAGANVISLHVRIGAWGAVQVGFRYAEKECFDAVVTMDADGQHSAKFIHDLAAPVLNGESDVTIGVCTSRGSVLRRLAWEFFRKISRLGIEDLTSGFRTYNRSAITVLLSREATMLSYQDIGVLILLRNAGTRISEVGVTMFTRTMGISRIYCSWTAVSMYIAQTFLLCISKISLTWTPNRKQT